MKAPNDANLKALANVRSFLRDDALFPEYVFMESWSRFLFFDSGWVTHNKHFVEEAKALLEIDSSQCACILCLGRKPGMEWPPFYFNEDVTDSDYGSFLNGLTHGDGIMMNAVGRFVCAPAVGKWCIYCENQAEIGVMAIRDANAMGKYISVLARFSPLPIDQAIATPQTYGFEHLSEKYRIGLLEHYAIPSE